MDLSQIIAVVSAGIIVGGLYSLTALGLTLILGVMRIINLAHGSFFMLGCFSCYFIVTWITINPVWIFLLTTAILFGIALAIERLVVRHTKGDLMRISVGTFSVAVFLEEAMRIKWGKIYRSVPPSFAGTTDVFGVTFDNQRLVAFLVSVLIIIGLILYIKRGKFGRAIRMVQQDNEMAGLLGINVNLVNVIVFGIAGALAGAAASLLTPLYMIYPAMGWPPLLKSFAIVILGGMGSIGGTIIASFIFGIVEIGTSFFIGSQWAYAAVFVMLIVILLVRPRGIFGKDIF